MNQLKATGYAVVFSFLALAGAQNLWAQSEYHHLTFNVGGGLTSPTGRISNYIDYGGEFQAAAGINFNQYLGVLGTYSFNTVGLTGRALSQINVPDGYGHVNTLTVDPKISFPMGRGSFYVLGGGGWLRRTVTYTQPVLASTFVFDPWWGYVGPAYFTANEKLGAVSNNAGVWDIGGGFNIPLGHSGMKAYVEARYYDGLTPNTHTTIVPLTVGLRW